MLCSHAASLGTPGVGRGGGAGRERETKRKQTLVSVLLLRTPILQGRAPPSRSHLTVFTSLKSLSPNTVTLWGSGFKMQISGDIIQSITTRVRGREGQGVRILELNGPGRFIFPSTSRATKSTQEVMHRYCSLRFTGEGTEAPKLKS